MLARELRRRFRILSENRDSHARGVFLYVVIFFTPEALHRKPVTGGGIDRAASPSLIARWGKSGEILNFDPNEPANAASDLFRVQFFKEINIAMAHPDLSCNPLLQRKLG